LRFSNVINNIIDHEATKFAYNNNRFNCPIRPDSSPKSRQTDRQTQQ